AIGEPRERYLAQAVKCAVPRQSGGVAPCAKLLTKITSAVVLAALGGEERQLPRRRRVEDRLQLGVHRNGEPRAGLLLRDAEHAVLDVLPPHANDVAAPLRSVKPEPERKASLAADRIRRLELRNLVLGPGVMPTRARKLALDAGGRVVVGQSMLDAVRHQMPDGLEPIACGVRLHAVELTHDELLRQHGDRLVAIRLAPAL